MAEMNGGAADDGMFSFLQRLTLRIRSDLCKVPMRGFSWRRYVERAYPCQRIAVASKTMSFSRV
jgi:hypothetical protein